MIKSKILAKKISDKNRKQLEKASLRNNPFGNFNLSYLTKVKNNWFNFIEQLTLTGFLIYIDQKTNNIAARILVLISGAIWFIYLTPLFFTIYRMLLRSIFSKSKFWWQLCILVAILLVSLFYFANSFFELFRLLH